MKKNLLFLFLIAVFSVPGFSLSITKEYDIDNLYSIELAIDTDNKTLRVNLFSKNEDAFDENYAEECFTYEVETIINEYGFSESILQSSNKVEDYKGKYTMVTRNYSLK